MSFFNDLLEKPANLSAESKYAVMNGYIYLAFGGLLVVWPGAVQTIFMDAPFAGNESALFRVIGMTVMVIGWLYVFGGRSGARQFGPAADRRSGDDRSAGARACRDSRRVSSCLPGVCDS